MSEAARACIHISRAAFTTCGRVPASTLRLVARATSSMARASSSCASANCEVIWTSVSPAFTFCPSST